MLSSAEIFKILDELGVSSGSVTKSDLLQGVASKCIDHLLEESVFCAPQSDRSREALRRQKADKPDELNFILSVSDVLRLEESRVEHCLNTVLHDVFSPDQRAGATGTAATVSLEQLGRAREVYVADHENHWLLLQELLRVDMDGEHAYHQQAATHVERFMQGGLVSRLLSYTDYLRDWRPGSSELGLLTHHPGQALVQFAHSNDKAWATAYLREIGNVVDTLILLGYSRQSLGLEQLAHAVKRFVTQPLAVDTNRALQSLLYRAMRLEVEKVQAGILAVNFKFVVLFAECFQFWRAFGSNPELMLDHPVFEGQAPDAFTVVETLDSTTDLLSRSLEGAQAKAHREEHQRQFLALNTRVKAASGSALLQQPAIKVTLWLWNLFLSTFVPRAKLLPVTALDLGREEVLDGLVAMVRENLGDSDMVVDASGRRHTASATRRIRSCMLVASRDAHAHLVHAPLQFVPSTSSSNNGSGNGGSSGANRFHYCSVLQELTNILVHTVTLDEHDAGAINELGNVSTLVELTYGADPELCAVFWSSWRDWQAQLQEHQRQQQDWANRSTASMRPAEAPSASYPLCRLVQILVERTPHDPIYLLRMLAALACSPAACASIAQEILNQPAPLITYEPLESLVFRATLPSVHLGSNARNVEVVANDIESLEVAPSTAADFRGSSLRGWSTPIQWDRPYRWVREHGGTVAAGTAAMKVPAHDAARYAARVLSQQPSSGSHTRHQHQHHQLIPFGAAEGLGVGGTSSTRPHLRGSSLYEPEALAYGTVLSTDFSGDAQELLDGAGLGLSSMGLSEAEPRSLGRALVQWHGQQYVWWAVLVEMLMQLTAATSASLEQDPDLGAQVPAVIALLNRLLSGCPQNIVFISTKWNEVALYTLLRELNLLQYFSVLSEHDVHIDALRGSPCPSSNWHSSASASFDLLTAIGVPRLVAEEMVVRARSPSTQESALYELSLCDVITKAAANVLVLSIHAANAAVGQAAAATAGGTGGSRAARGTAINIGQARALFLASSGLFATLFSVSRQWAFSAATYSHTVLGLHEHALLSDTGHRDSLLEQLHTVAMRWPHLTEPVFAHVNDLSAAWFTLFPLWSISNAPVLQLFRLLLQVQDQDQPRSADSSSIAAAASSAAGSASLRIDTLARVLVVDFEVDISSKELVDVCSALGLLHPLQPADQSSSSCGNSSGRLGGNRNSLGNSSKDMDHYRLDVLQFLKLVTGADVAHQPVPVSSAKDPSTHAHRAPIDSALARIRSQLRSVLRRSEFTDGLAAPGQQSSAATAAGGVPSRRLGVREVDLMRTTVVFLLNEYTHLVRAPDSLPVGPEGTCSLLLDCLSSMQAAFTHCSNAATAAAVAESPAYHLMLNAASSAQFLESLVQLSLLPAVIAICTGGGAPADTTSSSSSFSSLIIRVDSSRPRTFRELLQRGGDTSRSGAPDHQQSGDRAQTVCGGGGGGGGIGSGNMGCLPLLFSAFRSGQPLVSHALVELVLRVAHLASSLLAHMLEYAAVLSNGQVGAGEAEEQRAVDAELRGCGAAVTSALMTAYTTHCSPGTALPWLMTLFISSSKTGSSSSDGAQSSLLQSSSGIGTSSMHASDLPAQRRYVTLLAGMLDELRVSTRSTTASADSVSEGSLITSCRELVVAHRTVSARLLLQVVQALPVGPSFSSLSEYIGTGNIVPLCGILCRLLSASASSGSGSGASSTTVAADGDALKVQVMQLLLILAQRHPATLCMLLSISDKAVAECDNGSSGPAAQCLGLTGTAPAALASSALLRALLQCLGSAELLFTRCPLLLHALYRFVTLLAQARDFGLMRRAALHLAQERGFWDHVTVPLMVDVPPPPPLEFSVAPLDLHSTFPVSAGAGEVAAEDGRDHTGTSTSPPASPAAVAADKLCAAFIRCKTSGEAWRSSSADCGTTVTRYAQQLRCHASALELLSIERYGIFYEINTAAAAKITKKTQSFYVKATETHRFISWIKHYLSIRIDDSLVQSVVKQARVLGINLSELSVLRQGLRASSSSRAGSGVGLGAEREALGSSVELPLQTEECYGPDFQLSTSRLRALVESTFLCAMFSGSSSTSDYSTGADDGAVELDDVVRTTLYLQTRLLASVQALNCSCSLSRASFALVRAWRKFLEFYVLPGSALKQHVDSLAGAGEGGAAGAGASGGGSAVDVVRHPASGSPILVGALSPTSSGPSASPVSQKQSSFSGDRRSYEVVGEVVAHLERHRTDGLMLSALGRCAVAEKCELLVSMLHHQLKQVGSRASEPGQSEVRARDIGSMRLTQDKMELLLQKLDGCYHDMIFATAAGSADEAAEEQAAAQATRRRSSRNAACSATNSGRDGDSIDDEGETFASEIDAMFLTLAGESLSEASGGEASKTAPISSSSFTASVEVALAHSSALKSQVALRLLTAMALLLRAICTFNSSDEARSRLSARRRSVFRYAVVALRNLIEAYGAHRLFACLSMTSGSSSSNSGSDSYGRGDSSSWTPTRPRRNERGAEEAKAATPGGGSHNSSSGSGHSSSSSLQLVSGQAIAHLCLQILQLAIPPSSTRAPLVSVTDKSEWTLLLQSTQTVPLLTAIIRKLSTSTSSAAGGCSAAVLAECDYTAWNSETVIADVSRPCAEFTKLKRKIAWSDAASLSDGGGRGERGGGSQELQPLVEALTSCLDVAIAAMGANIFMIQHTEWVAELVKVLCDSPLLHAYQQALAAQPEDIAAILAGYSGINGQQSVLARLWLKTLAFVELVVVSLQESSNNLVGSGAVADSSNSSNGSSSGGDRSSAGIRRSVDPATGLDADTSGEAPISALKMRLGHQLCSFLRTYVPLLLLPLRPQPALRYSAQQLRFVRASFSLFTSCHTYFPSWRVELPAVAQEVQLRALATGRTFSLLLGSGDGAELPDQQRRLLGHLVAVSEAEKRMGRRDVRRRRAERVRGMSVSADDAAGLSAHVHFGENVVHVFGGSKTSSQGSMDSQRSKQQAGQGQGQGQGPGEEGGDYGSSSSISIAKSGDTGAEVLTRQQPLSVGLPSALKHARASAGGHGGGVGSLGSLGGRLQAAEQQRLALGWESAEGMQAFSRHMEVLLLAALVPIVTCMRQSTPQPMEATHFDELGHAVFMPGSRVFYISAVTGELTEGIIYRMNNGSGASGGDGASATATAEAAVLFDVVLPDDRVESQVHPAQVRFTSQPLLLYQSTASLSRHDHLPDPSAPAPASVSWDAARGRRSGSAEDALQAAALASGMSTAHLMKTLQFCTSTTTWMRLLQPAADLAGVVATTTSPIVAGAGEFALDPPGAALIASDLEVLAGQLAWLVVANVAHHALAPLGRETSMYHQLLDLRRLLRCKDPAAASGGLLGNSSSLDLCQTLGSIGEAGGASTPTSSLLGTPGGVGQQVGAQLGQALQQQWQQGAQWIAYVHWLDKWCEEIFYMLGQRRFFATSTAEDAEGQDMETEAEARRRRKRVGLRARIEWVQSPDEV